MPVYQIYFCSYWCNTTYFATFPEVTIVRCSKKYLFLKYDRKIRAEFLEMLEDAMYFQTYAEICIFCSAMQYIVSKKQPVGSAYEVLVESSETVFD